MGTNFYWKTGPLDGDEMSLPTGGDIENGFDSDDPRHHIGKRSAAGLYCWDCNQTLCMGGNRSIHAGRGDWHGVCPICGKGATDEGLDAGPVALELGFAGPRPIRPSGVRGCSSFSWAQDPVRVREVCEANLEKAIVVDEYDREYTGNQFLGMLAANCPVEFTDSIGRRFS